MNYQNQIIRLTDETVEGLFRTVRAMPADKLEWKPLDAGRSALDQLQECAQSAGWTTGMVQARAMPPMDAAQMGALMETMGAERKAWTTIDACEAVCREKLAEFYAVVRDFPDEDLDLEIILPFGGGMKKTMADLMVIPYWNMTYHCGQINFIQTLYGDKDSH